MIIGSSKHGAVCLSQDIPKTIEDIEQLVQEDLEEQSFEDEDDEELGLFHDDEDEDMEH